MHKSVNKRQKKNYTQYNNIIINTVSVYYHRDAIVRWLVESCHRPRRRTDVRTPEDDRRPESRCDIITHRSLTSKNPHEVQRAHGGGNRGEWRVYEILVIIILPITSKNDNIIMYRHGRTSDRRSTPVADRRFLSV